MDEQTQANNAYDTTENPTPEGQYLEGIRYTHAEIVKLRDAIKDKRDELNSELLQSEEYKTACENAKAAMTARTQAKARAMARPTCASKADEISGLTEDLRNNRATMSMYVLQYREKSGAEQLELFDGVEFEIVTVGKLKKIKKVKTKN